MAAATESLKADAAVENWASITSLDFGDALDWQLGSSLAEVHPALRRMPSEGYKILSDDEEVEKPITPPSDSDSAEEPLTPPFSKPKPVVPVEYDGGSDKIAVTVDSEGTGIIPLDTTTVDWASSAPRFSQSAIDLSHGYNGAKSTTDLATPISAIDGAIPARGRTRVYRPTLHPIPSQVVPLPKLPHQRLAHHPKCKMAHLTMASQPALVEAPDLNIEIQPDTTYSTYFPDRPSQRYKSQRVTRAPTQASSSPARPLRPAFSYENIAETIDTPLKSISSRSNSSSLDLHLNRYASSHRRGFSIRFKSLSRSSSGLIQAAKLGDFAETLRRLTTETGRLELSATDREGYTALHHASALGHSDIVRALLLRNADVESCTKKKHRTPLYLAAENGHVDVVQVLLAEQANANRGGKDDGVTPLHIASKRGHVKIIELLISAGADVNRLDLANVSPLIYSMRGHQLPAARLLYRRGADLEQRMRLSVKPNFGSEEGLTALHYAVEMGNHAFAKLFLKLGADPNSDAQGGERALHRAAMRGDEEMVQMLLAAGAKVMARTNELWTPLHSAAKTGQKRVCHALLQAGAHLNATNNKRQTAKQMARANGFPECFVKETRRQTY